MTRRASLSPLARYRRVLAALRSERGERCEACGEPTRSAHHVNAVGITGIADALAYEPANLLLLCDHCHTLMHPGRRAYSWLAAKHHRANALNRSRRP